MSRLVFGGHVGGKLFQICGSSKASVSEAVVRTWHRAHVVKGRSESPSVAFKDETDIISQVGRHLTTQCLTHQIHVGEFELHSAPNWKPASAAPSLVNSKINNYYMDPERVCTQQLLQFMRGPRSTSRCTQV